MFARMSDIMRGALDEDGLGINNTEKALARIGVKLRESEDTFRNFGDVIMDVMGKWKNISDIEKANVAKAIAGKIPDARTYGDIGVCL